MAENIFSTFAISGQGMSVQRMRLSAVANNIANVNTTKDVNGEPYKREVTVVRAIPGSPFEEELSSQISLQSTNPAHASAAINDPSGDESSVLKAATVRDNAPPKLVYDPGHPDADANGYVKMPNINVVTEMVEMITAQRAFESNTQVIESAKNIARNSLDI